MLPDEMENNLKSDILSGWHNNSLIVRLLDDLFQTVAFSPVLLFMHMHMCNLSQVQTVSNLGMSLYWFLNLKN